MSTINETELLEDTIDFDVDIDGIGHTGETPVLDHAFSENKVEAGRGSIFQERIQLQEKSIAKIQAILQQGQKKMFILAYFGLLGFIGFVSAIAVLYFMSRSKESTMFFFGILAGFISLVTFAVLILEGYKFLQLRRYMNYISVDLLKDNAMNIEEKQTGLTTFNKIKDVLNGVTMLAVFLGTEIKEAAVEFQTLRCISDVDKARILELREHELVFVERVNKALDQRQRLEEEIIHVTTNQSNYMKELELLNESIRSIPALKNDFGISHDRYNNLGGEAAEQALENEWKTRVDEVLGNLQILEGEKARVSEQLEATKKEAEQKYNESKKVKNDKEKQRTKLEKDKQALGKKINHAHADFESASKNIVETNEKIRQIDSRLLQNLPETERQQLLSERKHLEDQMRKHVNVSEKAKIFIDTSNPTEFDLRIASIQSDLLKHTQETEEMIHFYEGEVNKLQNELNRKMRELMQAEETLKLRQSQRQTALMPFQEQVEIMLALDKKIRDIMQKERDEKPSLEAKIAGVTQRIDNLSVEKATLEIKIRDDKQLLSSIEDEIQNLSNNFIN